MPLVLLNSQTTVPKSLGLKALRPSTLPRLTASRGIVTWRPIRWLVADGRTGTTSRLDSTGSTPATTASISTLCRVLARSSHRTCTCTNLRFRPATRSTVPLVTVRTIVKVVLPVSPGCTSTVRLTISSQDWLGWPLTGRSVLNWRRLSISSVAMRVASARCLETSLLSRNVACTPTRDSMPKAITASATSASISETPSRRCGMRCFDMVRSRLSEVSNCQAPAQTSRSAGG